MGAALGKEGWVDLELSPLFGSGLDCGLWIRMTLGEAGPEPAGEMLADGGPRVVAGTLGESASLSHASMVSPARNAAAWKAEHGSTSPVPSGSSSPSAPVAAGPVSSSTGKSFSGVSLGRRCGEVCSQARRGRREKAPPAMHARTDAVASEACQLHTSPWPWP